MISIDDIEAFKEYNEVMTEKESDHKDKEQKSELSADDILIEATPMMNIQAGFRLFNL